jgi:hypothetical protein
VKTLIFEKIVQNVTGSIKKKYATTIAYNLSNEIKTRDLKKTYSILQQNYECIKYTQITLPLRNAWEIGICRAIARRIAQWHSTFCLLIEKHNQNNVSLFDGGLQLRQG